MHKFSKDDFRKKLNPSQLEAVVNINGPVLVVAGAGTGKTRVIEYRCVYMMHEGIKPEEILLLTFTRKAAREMLGRACLHDAQCKKIEGGTFHSFAYRVIKKYKKVIGLGDNISFIDEADSADVLHLLAARDGCLEDKARFPKKDTLRSIVSMSINRHQSVRDILARDYPHFLNFASHIEDLRKKYAEYKISRNLIDFDDMLIYLKFLLEDPVVNEKVSSQFKYLMVDEFQDTNRIQADIVYLLCRNHHNCMVVGDDTQSIYSFRGAYYKNMFDFPKRFEDTRIIKLEYNYRSVQPILDLANSIIEGEKEKYSKELFTTREGTDKPTLSFFKDPFAEAQAIAHKIKDYHDTGLALRDIGILYRSNFLSLPLQLELSKLNIQFAVYGGMKFTETAHIKDVLAFLKVHHNPLDELSLSRVLMLLDGIGPKTAEKLRGIILKGDKNAADEALKGIVKSPSQRKELLNLVELFISLSESGEVERKIKKVIHFYTPYLKKKFDDYPVRQDDLKAFLEISSSYTSVEQFLVDFVTLEPPERSLVSVEGKKEDESPVVLSTVHSSKGLEWEVVFILGACDGSIPVSYALDDDEAIEEERRLLYVAVTRAKTYLHISMHNEGRNGGMNSFNRLSRFIREGRVMEKLETDYAWFDEGELPLEDATHASMDRKGLYRKFSEYLDENNYGEDNF